MTNRLAATLSVFVLVLSACSMDWTMAERDGDGGLEAEGDVEADGDGGTEGDADVDIGGDADEDGDEDVAADDGDAPGPDADGDAEADDAPGADADADADTDADGDADADAGGLVLHAVGMATVAGEGLTASTLRLTEVGFEGGGRSCAGSLCLWIGVAP